MLAASHAQAQGYQQPAGADQQQRPVVNKPRKKRKRSPAMKAIGIVFKIVLVIAITLFFILPSMKPYREDALEYLLAGLLP